MRGRPTGVLHLTPRSICRRLLAAGFTRHVRGEAAGFDICRSPRGIEVSLLDVDGEILAPDDRMKAWGWFLAAVGYAVLVDEETHLLVTLPAGGVRTALHAVERTA